MCYRVGKSYFSSLAGISGLSFSLLSQYWFLIADSADALQGKQSGMKRRKDRDELSGLEAGKEQIKMCNGEREGRLNIRKEGKVISDGEPERKSWLPRQR